MSPDARVAFAAHRTATRKKRVELRQRGLPMIIWKDGAVREIPAQDAYRVQRDVKCDENQTPFFEFYS